MAKFLLVWEMGANYGHIGALLPLASRLKQRGHEVCLSLQQPGQLAHLSQDHFGPCLQSPRLLAEPMPIRTLHSFADVLLKTGFGNAERLLAAVGAWRMMYRQVLPDVIVLNSAPTALLAAQGFPAKKVLYGHGFDLPPQTNPLPAFRSWASPPHALRAEIEARALESINFVQDHLHQPAFGSLSAFMRADERILFAVRELDHYPQRPPEKYWGKITTTDAGLPFQWLGRKKKVFAYVRPTQVDLRRMAAQMCDPACEYAVVAPGISTEECRRLSGPERRVFNAAVRIDDVVAECDVAICHAGIGTVISFLIQGVPLLLLPGQLEQLMLARNFAERGYGLYLNPSDPGLDIGKAVKQLLREPKFRIRALEFSRKYLPQQAAWMTDIVDRLCALSASGRNAAAQPGAPLGTLS